MTDYYLTRVSSDEQKQTGLSIEAQHDKAITLNIPKEQIKSEAGISGGFKRNQTILTLTEEGFLIKVKFDNRPELLRLTKIMKAGDTLHYSKHDRLTRSIYFMEILKDWADKTGITLQAEEESNEELVQGILTVVSQAELNKTADRNQKVSQAVFLRDGWAWKSPIGYLKNYKDKITKQLRYPHLPEGSLIIDPTKSSMIINIFNRMAKGEHYQQICDDHKINNKTLYNIIKNRVYLGETHDENNIWKPTNLIPAIIDEATWNKAQKNIKTKIN